MKVFNNVHIPRAVKSLVFATPLVLASSLSSANYVLQRDTFEKTEQTSASQFGVHAKEETPMLIVGGEDIYPAVVVDLSDNKLYQYDCEGYLEECYSVATGKATTPTKTGLRVVTAIEDYPFKEAYSGTRRYKYPDDYGSKVICLAPVDMKTGKILEADGQFIHGTNNPNSIGKKASKGCVRMHNNDVEALANVLDVGQYVLIQE